MSQDNVSDTTNVATVTKTSSTVSETSQSLTSSNSNVSSTIKHATPATLSVVSDNARLDCARAELQAEIDKARRRAERFNTEYKKPDLSRLIQTLGLNSTEARRLLAEFDKGTSPSNTTNMEELSTAQPASENDSSNDVIPAVQSTIESANTTTQSAEPVPATLEALVLPDDALSGPSAEAQEEMRMRRIRAERFDGSYNADTKLATEAWEALGPHLMPKDKMSVDRLRELAELHRKSQTIRGRIERRVGEHDVRISNRTIQRIADDATVSSERPKFIGHAKSEDTSETTVTNNDNDPQGTVATSTENINEDIAMKTDSNTVIDKEQTAAEEEISVDSIDKKQSTIPNVNEMLQVDDDQRMDVDMSNEFGGAETLQDVIIRQDVLHIRRGGYIPLGTRDIMEHFREYGASWIEWLNGESVNVIFKSIQDAEKAFRELSMPVPSVSNVPAVHPAWRVSATPIRKLRTDRYGKKGDKFTVFMRWATSNDTKEKAVGTAGASTFGLRSGRYGQKTLDDTTSRQHSGQSRRNNNNKRSTKDKRKRIEEDGPSRPIKGRGSTKFRRG